MSLYKQLWVAIALLLAVVFTINVWVTTISARDYLNQQLSMKNADNASALALSLSQQGADDVLLELTLAAQFDTGFYEHIELTDPQGNSAILRVDERPARGAPGWFVRLFPINAEPGVASVQAGWQQAGTLTLRSHSRFAYGELWRGSIRQAGIFLLAAVLAGLIGARALKGILRPLNAVVKQADALRARRFITIPEPATLEFKQLVRAMNGMSTHVKGVLDQEAQRLERWQREAQIDAVTGLTQREPYLQKLAALLESREAESSGSLVLLRIAGLAQLNSDYGRKAIDEILCEIGDQLIRFLAPNSGWAGGRLNGSDIALVAPGDFEAEALARDVLELVNRVFSEHQLGHECSTPGAATIYQPGDTVAQLLTRLDTALPTVQEGEHATIAYCAPEDPFAQPMQQRAEHWQGVLEHALQSDQLGLARFPVLDTQGELIHFESPVTLNEGANRLPAAQFLPWIHRLKLEGDLDQAVATMALARTTEQSQPVAVNLSAAALYDKHYAGWLDKQLAQNKEAATLLWLELTEDSVFRHLEAFKQLCTVVQPRGVTVGIKHAGHRLAELGRLHDVGLDYLKIDASFVRDIAENNNSQTMLSAFCTLGHAIGLRVIAEGVHSDAQWTTLRQLGVDGATGPGIRLKE
ncbi:MAG: EAL domain-containing protein [Halioglobus sp.]